MAIPNDFNYEKSNYIPVNRLNQYFGTSPNYDKIKMQDLVQQTNQIREAVKQIISRIQVAASKEESNMSDLHNIDTRLSVVENEIKHITSSIDRTERRIDNLDQKFDRFIERLDVRFEKLDEKLETFVTKDELKQATDSKRFTTTTWISLISAVGAIAAAIAAFIALAQ